MLATEILTQDHREAIDLVEQLEGVRNDAPGNKETFEELANALLLHMREEEQIYYPALAEYEEFADMMEENIAEHEMVKQNIVQMRELSVSDAEFQKLLTETKAALEMHMTVEEDDVFPRSLELLGRERIDQLGTEIDQMKAELDPGLSSSARM
jgi:iron-sulfur cluster repair protein YtfE (RIC family)